jgi:hypothetical protein
MSISTIQPDSDPILPDRGTRGGYGMDERIYRPRWWARLIGGTIGVAFIAAGVFGIAYLILHPGLSAGNLWIGLICCGLLILITSLNLLELLRKRLILTPDAVEYVDGFRWRRLARRDIKGYRIIFQSARSPALEWYNWECIFIVPVEGAGKPLRLGKFFRIDDPFRAWLAGLPDLDEPARREAEAEIRSNPAWGATAEARSGTLSRANRTVNVLSLATLALAVVAAEIFEPPVILILALVAMPWVAIAIHLTRQGIFVSTISRTETRPTLFIPLFVSGLPLALRAAIDYQPLDWQLSIGAGLIAGGLFAAAAAFADKSLLKDSVRLLIILPFAVAYGFGVVGEANGGLDTAPPTIERATVFTKSLQNGYSWLAVPKARLQLSPWGARTVPTDAAVSESLWNATRFGEAVCVNIHPGLLRLPWLTVTACSTAPPAPKRR